MLQKEFVPSQESSELKKLGFNEPCLKFYAAGMLALVPDAENGDTNSKLDGFNPLYVSAPTFSQAFRWFREKYNLRGFIGFRPNVKQFDCHVYDMSLSGEEYIKQRTMEEYNKDPKVGTYEEAELACLRKLIEIVQGGKQ